jgi:peptide/nickel transport system permease protein
MSVQSAIPRTMLRRHSPRKRRRRNRKVTIGVVGLGIFILLGIFGAVLAPHDPSATSAAILQGPSGSHLLGTTQTGQDVLSQLLVSTGPSLLVGFLAAGIATLLSVVVGLLSGYLLGWGSELLTLVSNVFLVIPALPLLIVVTGYLSDRGNLVLALVIGLTGWAFGARIIRAQTLSLRNRDHLESARAAGESILRITVFEIMPSLIPLIASIFLLTIVFAIGTQAGLLFLGLGNISQWTWGTMLYWAQNDQAFTQSAWWWYVPPGLAIALVGLLLAMINFGIDEQANGRLRSTVSGDRRRAGRRSARGPTAPPEDLGDGQPASDDVVRIRDLSVEYGSGEDRVCAVQGVNLALRRGEILGLAGESGSGKSTLLYGMTRLLPANAQVSTGGVSYQPLGEPPVELLDLEGQALRAVRWKRIAVVFQSAMNALNPVSTVESQLTDVLRAHHVDLNRRGQHERAAELLQLVGITADRLKAYPHELSGGMRQRVMIAMSLALSPEVLVMDEPTTALDVVTQRQIVGQVVELRERLGLSVVFVTHDLALLLEIADRVAIMYAGRIVELATAAELRAGAAHPYTNGLLRSFPTLTPSDRLLNGIPGSPPDMRAVPDGCPFHPRCEYAGRPCVTTAPTLREPASRAVSGRVVACYLHEDALAERRTRELSVAGEVSGRDGS